MDRSSRVRDSSSSVCRTLNSDDGAIEYRLTPTSSGLLVERVQRRMGSRRIVLSTLFADGDSFERWCDADSIRFECPLVYTSLKRDGRVFFGGGA
ncbi:hypothetical protein BURC_02080 [Burkholderiaceae bacterium]|nr:hypothetical protein BURC_02080 [Burkholderiaceae bacterium]